MGRFSSIHDIGGIVVSFNSGVSLLTTIKAVTEQVDTLIIVDNGSDDETLKTLEIVEAQHLAKVLRLDRNYGIAFALNRGVEILLLENVNWIVTFDQDSTPINSMVKNMLEFAGLNKQSSSPPLLSPSILYDCEESTCSDKHGCKTIPVAITSGNMVSSTLFKKIGLYDEDLFIDSVDFDFCLRARLAGYQILRVNSAVLKHKLGDSTKYYLLGVTFQTYTHSPLRRYYIMRNHLYLQEKYLYNFPYLFLKKNFFIVVMIMQIILFDSEKISNLKMMMIGISHYLKRIKGQFT
jgi:rhamnosyltransferase